MTTTIRTKAIRVTEAGGPDAMVLEEVTLPPPGPSEVRIRHRAIGINYIDVYFRAGAYPTPMPLTPGSEGAGDVLAVGEGVTGFKPGDRVAYAGPLGSYCEERNIVASALVTLPPEISYETGAAMMLKGMTAQYLLRRTYHVKAGDTVLMHAAAGGVGLILCQWAKHLGATVIGTVGSADKAELAKAHGCDHVILYRDEDFAARVNEITAGAKCEVVYDGVGKATFPASLDCLKPFGMFVSFGAASGSIDAFNIGLLAQKGSLYATRPTLFTHTAKHEVLLEMAGDVIDVLRSGAVKLDIHKSWPLAEAADAHRALEARETTGALLLIP